MKKNKYEIENRVESMVQKVEKGNFSFDCIITTYKNELFPAPYRCSSMRANFYIWSLVTRTHGRKTMYKNGILSTLNSCYLFQCSQSKWLRTGYYTCTNR